MLWWPGFALARPRVTIAHSHAREVVACVDREGTAKHSWGAILRQSRHFNEN